MRIPTTVITGHLGAGKTSAIAHFLKQRRPDERWAVIVNEFGELGIDGASLMDNSAASSLDGVLLKEITGACICCGMGAPLLFVLEKLLKAQRFDRLLIEPTGMAEPLAVTDSFSAPSIHDRLQRNALICLLDMRSVAQQRWSRHATFQRQAFAADVLVGNFADEASATDARAFNDAAATWEPAKSAVFTATNGQIDRKWLDCRPLTSSSATVATISAEKHTHHERARHEEIAESLSIELPSTAILDRSQLTTLLTALAPKLMRAKGFVRTAYGHTRFDIDGGGTLRWRTIPAAPSSTLVFIAATGTVDWQALEQEIAQLSAVNLDG